MGASVGREAAPKLMGGVSGSLLARWMGLTPAQRRLLVACGGGAGLAAVYNVPLGGPCSPPRSLWAVSRCRRCCPPWRVRSSRPWSPGVPAEHRDLRGHSQLSLQRLAHGLVAARGCRDWALVDLLRAPHWLGVGASGLGRVYLLEDAARLLVIGVVGIWYPQLFGNGKTWPTTRSSDSAERAVVRALRP